MLLKITFKAMEIYVWIVCIAILIGVFCLMPVASLLDPENSVDNIF